MLIVSVGKKTTVNLQNEINNYLKRLDFKVELTLIEPPKGNISNKQKKDLESTLILDKLARLKSVYTILLDETGENISSIELSEKINRINNQSLIPVFIIGGAFGVNNKVYEKVHFKWSLSKLVLPHQLVRLVLIEQIYRAKNIIDNTGYHHL
jgi:23S rRNA (pseudouridine1915-N3)-methyltransferase